MLHARFDSMVGGVKTTRDGPLKTLGGVSSVEYRRYLPRAVQGML